MKVNIKNVSTVITLFVAIALIVYQAGIISNDVSNLVSDNNKNKETIKIINLEASILKANNKNTSGEIKDITKKIEKINDKFFLLDEKITDSATEIRDLLIRTLNNE